MDCRILVLGGFCSPTLLLDQVVSLSLFLYLSPSRFARYVLGSTHTIGPYNQYLRPVVKAQVW